MPHFERPITPREIRKAARATVTVLHDNNFECCLFGSAACALYGMENRVPNDVDIIVFTDTDQEDVKELLVAGDDNFFLVPSANPNNSYHVLWYSLRAPVQEERTCKVDILTPGQLNIPKIPARQITYMRRFPGLPLAPFLALLLLKLQGWTDHRADNRQRMRAKIPEDEEDIHELLELAVENYGVELRKEKWMPRWFVRDGVERVGEFVDEFPDSTERWSEIGFNF